ncbi:MFS transporter [Chloroflexota bacterium]
MFLKFKDKLFYGWVVAVTLLCVSATLMGIHFSFGIFFKSIESEFNLTRAVTSTVVSTQMVFGGVFSFLGGWALDKYGPRIIILIMGLSAGLGLILTSQTNALWQLFATYSLLVAIGSSATYVVETSIVSRWFDKKRGLALGIAGSGTGVGAMVMAPFAAYLISNYDWRMAYIVMGLTAWLVVIPISRLLRRDPYEIGALPDGVKSYSNDIRSEEHSIQPEALSLLQTLRTRSFWLFMFVWLFFGSCFFLILTHLVPHVTDIGYSVGEAATMPGLIGVATIAGRMLMGIVSDRIGRKLTAIICALLMAGAFTSLPWIQGLLMLQLFALVFGFTYGGYGSSVSAIIGDTFGLYRIGAILGVLNVGFAIGASAGPAIGGLIFDSTGSYSVAFLIGGAAMLLASLLITQIKQETGRES